ncbi:MAG: hydrogenase 2 small subunit, partial [Sulfuritalea sp.]|nr:hydrogenase 2 small subunit [Sulfuritalea sp.]
MNDIFDTSRKTLQDVEKRLEMPRREFLQFCATLAATMGLPAGAEAAVAKAVEAAKRPSVIWLHFQECTGCSESLLRAEHPTLEKLILDVISLDYHETLMAAAGHQAEAARKAAMK